MSHSTKPQPKVLQGRPQALNETALGKPMDITRFLNRYVLINAEMCAGAPAHIAAHIIQNLSTEPEPYVEAHTHPDHDEIGIVVGPPGALEYELLLDGVAHRVQSPGAIFIPAGTVHRARAIRGTGAYVCMLMDPKGPSDANSSKAG